VNFGIFTRVPKDGTLDQFDAADLTTCKLVQIDWMCSRNFNQSDSTESFQSAEVVIRKK